MYVLSVLFILRGGRSFSHLQRKGEFLGNKTTDLRAAAHVFFLIDNYITPEQAGVREYNACAAPPSPETVLCGGTWY